MVGCRMYDDDRGIEFGELDRPYCSTQGGVTGCGIKTGTKTGSWGCEDVRPRDGNGGGGINWESVLNDRGSVRVSRDRDVVLDSDMVDMRRSALVMVMLRLVESACETTDVREGDLGR